VFWPVNLAATGGEELTIKISLFIIQLLMETIKFIYNYLGDTKSVYGDVETRESLESEIEKKLVVLGEQSKLYIKAVIFTFDTNQTQNLPYRVEAVIDSPDIDFSKSEESDNPSVAVHLICDDIIRYVRKEKEKLASSHQ
jgi:ribosome-associated translation inhibitor RaiA